MERQIQRARTNRPPCGSMPDRIPESSTAGPITVMGPASVLAEPVFGATRQSTRRARAGSAVHEET